MNAQTKAPRTDPSQWAAYVEAGATLIPLHAWNAVRTDKKGNKREAGKMPLDSGWQRKTYKSAETIQRAKEHGLNVGVRLPAGTVVVEYDPRRDPQGAEWPAFCKEFGIDGRKTPTVISGSGGKHLYMRLPKGTRVRDTVERFKAIEFKSLGRQMVAAGSVHPNGTVYRWAEGTPPLTQAPMAPAKLVETMRRPDPPESGAQGGVASPEKIAEALAALDVESYREHSVWFELMCSVHHASGGDARQEFIDWSVSDPDYADQQEVIGRRFDSLHAERGDGFTVRTLNKALSDAGRPELTFADGTAQDDFESEDDPRGDDPEGDPDSASPTQSFALKVNGNNNKAADTYSNAGGAILRAGYLPAWDELAQAIVFRGELPWDERNGRVLTNNNLQTLRAMLTVRFQGVQFEPSQDNVLNAAHAIALQNPFNPVLEYVGLLQWDGVPRVETLCSRHFGTADDAYTRGVSRAFMIGAVRRMRVPGCKFDTMPIFEGPQGWGKSTGLKVLFGADWFSDAQLGHLGSKDAPMVLLGKWVQEFSELESLSRSESATLKAFLSRGVDRYRPPFGRVVDDVPRRCVFVGTTNESEYLRDQTGGRRFWPLKLERPVDLDALAADRDQLWAEAAHREACGESDVLPSELWPVAAERQAQETIDDPWQDTLQHFVAQRAELYERSEFEEPGDDDPPVLPLDRVHASELYDALELAQRERTPATARRVSAAMQGMGWVRRRGVRVGEEVRVGFVRERPEGQCGA